MSGCSPRLIRATVPYNRASAGPGGGPGDRKDNHLEGASGAGGPARQDPLPQGDRRRRERRPGPPPDRPGSRAARHPPGAPGRHGRSQRGHRGLRAAALPARRPSGGDRIPPGDPLGPPGGCRGRRQAGGGGCQAGEAGGTPAQGCGEAPHGPGVGKLDGRPGACPRMSGAVIVDLQAVQSADYPERGIARHALEFTRALCEAHPDLVRAVLLNPDLPAPDPAPSSLRAIEASGRLGYAGSAGVSGGAIYHVISPFELAVPVERIWPPFVAEGRMQLVVTLHDLIPEVFPSHYLADPGLRRRYRVRRELVRAARRVLAVSETTRDEGIARLGLDPRRVRVIGAGISPGVRPASSPGEGQARARAELRSLESEFVLYVGGTDHRKNVEGLLTAYSLLPPELRARYQLVVAC